MVAVSRLISSGDRCIKENLGGIETLLIILFQVHRAHIGWPHIAVGSLRVASRMICRCFLDGGRGGSLVYDFGVRKDG